VLAGCSKEHHRMMKVSNSSEVFIGGEATLLYIIATLHNYEVYSVHLKKGIIDERHWKDIY